MPQSEMLWFSLMSSGPPVDRMISSWEIAEPGDNPRIFSTSGFSLRLCTFAFKFLASYSPVKSRGRRGAKRLLGSFSEYLSRHASSRFRSN